MSNNDFFMEEKCVPMKRAPAIKKPTPLPRELKPKFPSEPLPPSPMAPAPAPAYVAPTPPAPVTPPPPATPPVVEQEKSQNKEDGQANPLVQQQQPVNIEAPSAKDDVKTADNQENQNVEGQEPKKKKKPKKEKAPKKLEEGAAVAVFMDDDDDSGAFGNEKPKKKEAAPGQAVFVDEEEEEKEKESKRKDKKDKKKGEKKDKLGGKNERPGSVRQKKHALPAAFTAFANPGAPNQQGSVFQKKDQGSARNRNKTAAKPAAKNPAKPPAPPVPAAPAPVVKAGREPNEGFFKAMYSKAKTKIVAMSKNPNTPQSSSSSSSSTTSSVSMSGSDDTLIATDANLALKTEVAAVYGSAADYPRGVLPAKTDKNHPDKLFPGGRPFWLIRDEKPPEAKVILMSLVDQCLRDGTLTLVEPQEKPKELTPYAEDIKPLKAKDENYVLDASRILANTVYNTCHMKSLAFKALKDAKKPLDKPRIGKLKLIPPTQCAVYNRKQQKQKKYAKSPYKSAAGTDAHKAITKKKKSTASTD